VQEKGFIRVYAGAKSLLQEICQKAHLNLPKYTNIMTGKGWDSTCIVNDREFKSTVNWPAKKDAEIEAASICLAQMSKEIAMQATEVPQ